MCRVLGCGDFPHTVRTAPGPGRGSVNLWEAEAERYPNVDLRFLLGPARAGNRSAELGQCHSCGA